MQIASSIVMVSTKKIKPYNRNARKNDKSVAILVEMIPKVGFNVPLLLDRNNVIIKGHARYKAALKLGMAELPCIYSDNDEEANKLDRMADNRISELSSWDMEILPTELASLNLDFDFDVGLLDFSLPAPKAFPSFEPAAPSSLPSQATVAQKRSEADKDSEGASEETKDDESEYMKAKCPDCGKIFFVRLK